MTIKHETNETRRLEAFSDSVFAIAMTLLVIQIKVPTHEDVAARGLSWTLLALWPSYLAFVTSFVTILVIWVHHHWIFTLIKTIDHSLLYLNGVLLLFVTFVPFPTTLLADYLLDPNANAAASVYTGVFLSISLSFHVLWRHALRKLVPANAMSAKEVTQITKQYLLGPPLYFGAFVLSFATELWSIAMCLSLALFFAMGGWPLRR